ncbi:hypothetical protein TTHERM_00093960 (macronuclear) [Tetrahymena thermophila SB210]|uniref:Uncharacterized protein n=1 Tax=Tetrahymena thermophila (strain SB210) TaxID=312017 RepID=Q235Z5_TETTS|nr:hypothetical protein TTHERM_00093960 [Tetrahymena thermophila SB210]EAR92605.1 hypothetical protein TTHERM_00093960 [Tetrahymena thermophila SB210]|eukprot:XP_001012850.1 hypothetical protein TTHERM_00093960 [Tetrahymena thermophila SB210]
MQEERQKRDQVKHLEKEFTEKTQFMIQDIFSKLIFEHHRNNIKKIAECFKTNRNDLQKAHECSEQHEISQQRLEKRIYDFIQNHQEGITNCTSLCTTNIYTPVSECYQQCFQQFIEYSNIHIQQASQFIQTELGQQ